MGEPTIKATVLGVVMQTLMVVVGTYVPAIGQTPNFYALAGTVLAALTGAMVSRLSRGTATNQAAVGGAIAGGTSSVIGGLLAVISGQWPGFESVQLLYPAISGGVGGGIGALLGRLTGSPARAR